MIEQNKKDLKSKDFRSLLYTENNPLGEWFKRGLCR